MQHKTPHEMPSDFSRHPTEEINPTERRIARGTMTDWPSTMNVIAQSQAMRHMIDLVLRVSGVNVTVLITGESGSGKERIAQLIHEGSSRASRPFVSVNCGAIAESLLESELFGHARGAFTGATQDRPGLIEHAHTGTLFLDEIGELPLSMQAKLLRVLQEREVRRVGENIKRSVDVRILAATNRNLKNLVKNNKFRGDLLYRLKVVELHVPSLRERKQDIVPLANELLERASAQLNRNVVGFEDAALKRMQLYPWPGNVREMANAIEHAVALGIGDRVTLADLPMDVQGVEVENTSSIGDARPLAEVERDHILAVLELNGGNQTMTAQQLKIGKATLYRKLKKYRGD